MREEQIMEILSQITSQKKTADENTEKGYFNKVSTLLVPLGEHLREQMQAETSEKISLIISTLSH